jgi:carboxypeptidase Taq
VKSTTSRTAEPLGRFRDWMALLHDLQGAVRLLDWDRETLMPDRGAKARGHIVATLHALRHRELLRDGVSDDIALLEEHDDLTVAERAMVRLARREHDRAARVPEELVRATSEATSEAVTAWLSARADANFAAFAPSLERVVDLTRQKGEAVGIGAEPYDALLDAFEPGTTTARLEALFGELRRDLSAIVDGIEADGAHSPEPFSDRTWPAAAQLRVAEDLARMIGFDLDAGLISQSAHPFTGSPHAGDTRFTTRLTEQDPTGNVLVTLHELGHALYAQGLPAEFDRTLLFTSPSLGADESQSRFFENHIGRREAFWELIHPLFAERFGTAMDGLGPAAFHRAVTRAGRGWCRVDADEATYDLHIVLRFELELALIRGDLQVADLPGAWTDGMQRLLGVTPAHDGQGCLQDIHWAWGMFGYFPTYTLGNLYAAQLAEALEREEGPLDELVGAGALDVVLGFMRDRVHRHGDTYPTEELMRRATGEPFSTSPFIRRIRALAAT